MSEDKTKLTLSCSKEIINEAKLYANQEDDTISGLVEDFLRTYIEVKKNKAAGKEPFFNPQVAGLSGAVRLGKKRNYKKEFHT